MTTPLPTYRTTLGIAKEVTYGTAVPASNFIPVTSLEPNDKLDQLADEAWRGSAVTAYGHTPGPVYADFGWGGPVFGDGIQWAFSGLLGDVVTSGASAPFTHVTSLKNTTTTQGPSYTLSDIDAVNARQYPGMRVSEVGLKFDATGLLEYTAKACGLVSAINGSPPTPSFTTVPIQAAWTGISQIGGTATGVQLVSGEINFKRDCEYLNTVNGAQAPFYVWQGPLTVEGKATLVMMADTFYANYITGASTSLDFNFSQGAGAALTQLKVHGSNVLLTDASKTFGKSYIELELAFSFDANTTDAGASLGYSPTKVTIQNALASGTTI